MKAIITPKKLSGNIDAVSSKSYAHRILIASALSDRDTKININSISDDIKATVECLNNLGAEIIRTPYGYSVCPIKRGHINNNPSLDCNQSGSTLRFMLAVASCICDGFTITGNGRLPERPLADLIQLLKNHGVSILGDTLPLCCKNRLSSGEYRIRADISSQYITGLLLALPLLDGDSKIILEGQTESAAYIDMTLDVLEQYGVKVKKIQNGYLTEPSAYCSPKEISVEGDWSNAAFWYVANELGSDINIGGLNYNSKQGDKEIQNVLKRNEIDASQIPDLVPVIAVYAASKKSVTKIKNAQRLRTKESDRLTAVYTGLKNLGADIKITNDGLEIFGKGYLCGGECDSFDDHRIAMALAISSLICRNKVIINGCEAVNKSYPGFFDDFNKLNGEVITE